ncbi:General transcription factor II-I repeat domain-containing protein, partial [Ooceraea biroi]
LQKTNQIISQLVCHVDSFRKKFSLKNTAQINPRIVQIQEQSLDFQEELCDLQSDLFLKARPENGVEFFKILDVSRYPRLRNFGLRIFSMFGSTYLCECSFSRMKLTKTEKRSSLSDTSLSSLMLINSSKLSVDVSSLVAS